MTVLRGYDTTSTTTVLMQVLESTRSLIYWQLSYLLVDYP